MVDIPTSANFKARYPEFAALSDGLVDAFIAEASNMVDDDWETSDQKPAIMALAAHLAFMEGYPARLSGSFDPGTSSREMLMRRVGDVTVQYAQTDSTNSSGGGLLSSLGSSAYGQRFKQLLKLNAPAIGLV